MKLTKIQALKEAKSLGVDFSKDYHSQSFDNDLAELAKRSGYRKPKNANGSTGRYFFYHLQKLIGKQND